MKRFDAARAIADTILYEGYLLYPYTASARKNQQRWQFGVVMPAAYAASGTGEPWHMQTDVLVDGAQPASAVEVLVRFLQVQTRDVFAMRDGRFEAVESIELGGTRYITWEEAIEREVGCRFDLESSTLDLPICFPPSRLEETLKDESGAVCGRLIRETIELKGNIHIEARACDELCRLRVRIENGSVLAGEDRPAALKSAFLSCHTLLGLENCGVFISAMDVPEKNAGAAKTCKNEHTWPVLVGDATRDSRYGPMVLSSPIILYDYPANAPQSEGDKFDGTEVDELLNLSILTMSDDEKAEARATDPRAKKLIDRAQSMSAEHFAQLHGGIRFDEGPAFETEETQPGVAHLTVNGVLVQKGSRVRLCPSRRADVWDTFLNGKTARVKGVYEDFERRHYVAVSVDDDPASDMHDWYGRSLFFYPDEIEPLGAVT
ncbi:MAG: hypothetical protein M3R51_08440 [Candidatus Eremiobacteraeota bacterium]|nr:hypothetical protein [Candidatus Eremiobacteraeota bacterium]